MKRDGMRVTVGKKAMDGRRKERVKKDQGKNDREGELRSV